MARTLTSRDCLALALVLTATAACSAGGESLPGGRGAAERSSQPAAVPVVTATATAKAMPLDLSVIGSAEPYATVAVRAQVTGELTSVRFKEGDDVRRGQVLFTLDRRPLEAALSQAQATLSRDLAQADNARAQARRVQDLATRGIATREQLDTSNTAVAALDATLSADRAAVENATIQLQYSTIVAPISGRTGALMVHAGNLVRANEATPLVVINQVAPINVAFAIPEGRLPELKSYLARGSLRVEARAPNDAGPPATGRITFVDNAVDQATGTIKVKGTFANSDRRLWPGQFLNIVVTLTTDANAIVVPSVAVQVGQQGQFVFVVKADQTAEMRPVVVARTAGNESVIHQGLAAGETVVTDGQIRLVPGSKVSVKSGPGEKSEKSAGTP